MHLFQKEQIVKLLYLMKPVIAIISDDIIFSNLFIGLLTRDIPGLQIEVCKNLEEIDKKVNNPDCSLILVDGGLLGISSVEVIHFIRTSKLITCPIWFFPEILTEGYLFKIKEMGANRIISKPFDPFEVVDWIKTLLNL